MSRVLLVGIIMAVVLVVGVAAWILVPQFRGSEDGTEQDLASRFGFLQPAEEADRTIEEAPDLVNEDPDNDGLSTAQEQLWRTDPNNPDTDGDGFLDGEEVAANHDPTIPAPNDELAVPGQPAQAVPSAEQLLTTLPRFDQFYVDDLRLELPDRNLTEDFQREFGAGGSNAAMAEFARTHNIVAGLPTPESDEVADVVEVRVSTLDDYLALADNGNVLANSSRYSSAQYELVANNNPLPLQSYARSVRDYRQGLASIVVPEAAVPLHDLLLSYTKLLAVTLDEIAKRPDDPVKSMVASRQALVIDRQYYPLIRDEFTRLRSLQAQLVQAGP